MDAAEVFQRIEIPGQCHYVSVHPSEGEFMHRWIKEHGLCRTLEVGLAYGASAGCILSAHGGRHTCMDPFQSDFGDLGLKNLAALGFGDRLDFHRDASHNVLPRLVAEGQSYDFAFIDGNHLYDGIFVDFYYVDLLLGDRGFVLFHDAWMRGTQLVASFIRRNREDYRQISCPAKNMLLFQKIGRDRRSWDHFHEFYTWRSRLKHPLIRWMIRKDWAQRFLQRPSPQSGERGSRCDA